MQSLISPFEVYFILQLDSIRTAFVPIMIVSGLAFIISFILMCVNADESYNTEVKYYAFGKRMMKFATPCVLFALAGLTFIPTTKTAAAMVLLPAITSEAVTTPLTREAGELYDLAKQALKKAVNDEDTPETEKK